MNVSELFALHVSSEFSAYRGNLRGLQKSLADLPNVDDPAVRQHVEQLKRYLAKEGSPENDHFLLCLGLAIPGELRGINPPILVLSPERGGFSEKRLGEAAGRIRRLREALNLGYRFFPHLSRDTPTALQELFIHAFSPDIGDDEWVSAHTELSKPDAEILANRALECLTDSEDENIRQIGISVLQTLADFRDEGLGEKIEWLVEHEIFYPPNLYRNASDEVAEKLISRIGDTRNRLDLEHLLVAFAWTRNEVTRRTFVKWKDAPPRWASQLLVPVERYLHGAGWELESDGPRRELIAFSTYRILKEVKVTDEQLSIPCRVSVGEKCPGCGGALEWLFDFSKLPGSYFAEERKGAPRKLLLCSTCACFDAFFAGYMSDGSAQPHPATKPAEHEPFEPPVPCQCQLDPAPFPPFATNPFRLKNASTLGGAPTWIQDSEYPGCPECAKTMRFLAQFDSLAMKSPEDGTYFAFFCRDCQVSAVTYQQM